MKTMKHPDIETVGLEVRNLSGVDVLFTTDGKMLANQGGNGHIYYVNENVRYKTFRTSFLIDNEAVTMQGPVDVTGSAEVAHNG